MNVDMKVEFEIFNAMEFNDYDYNNNRKCATLSKKTKTNRTKEPQKQHKPKMRQNRRHDRDERKKRESTKRPDQRATLRETASEHPRKKERNCHDERRGEEKQMS